MTATNTRQLSWQYDDLAQQIQVKSLAAKLVLRHLGSKANGGGESHHGYASIAVHCCISERRVASALKDLRNLGLVQWDSGTGENTNCYRLNLLAMKQTVAVRDRRWLMRTLFCSMTFTSQLTRD